MFVEQSAGTFWRNINMKLCLVIVICASALRASDTFTSDSNGFSIELPSAPKSGVVATFLLPAQNGFTANVTIIKQFYFEDLRAYHELASDQHKESKVAMLHSKLSVDSIFYEFTDTREGRKMHWYQKVYKKEHTIYVATATALDEDWDSQKAELVKSIDSFKFNK